MTIERWTITDREEWLKRRKPNINGSEVGALFGCNPFQTRFALYAEKAGLKDADHTDNGAMRRGRVFEPAVANGVAEEHSDWKLHKCMHYAWSPEWRLGCTPDFWVSIPGRGRGVLQAKTVAKPIFDEKWQDGPPQWIVLQTLQEMMLEEVDWGIIAAMVMNSYDYEMKIYEFERHAGAEAKMISTAAKFWDDVAADRMPRADYTTDADVIRALYPRDNGETIDLTTDNRMPELLERYEHLSAIGNHADKELKAVKAEIADKLGAASAARLPGWQVTHKAQTRKATVIKESTFRVLRVKRLEQQQEIAA